jgi:hypothetical protein
MTDLLDGLRVLGVVGDYASLHRLLRARHVELGISLETLSQVSGIGYVAKLLEPAPVVDGWKNGRRHHGRALGPVSMGPLLGAMGCTLVLAEDLAATVRLQARSDWRPRSEITVNTRPRTTLDALIETRALALLEERERRAADPGFEASLARFMALKPAPAA